MKIRIITIDKTLPTVYFFKETASQNKQHNISTIKISSTRANNSPLNTIITLFFSITANLYIDAKSIIALPFSFKQQPRTFYLFINKMLDKRA